MTFPKEDGMETLAVAFAEHALTAPAAAPAKVNGTKQDKSNGTSKKDEKKKEAPKEAAPAAPVVDPEVVEKRFKICRNVGEECQTEADLRNLLTKKPAFNAYDGFEPSGRMHIAQGVAKMLNVNALTSCGGTFIFWVADWFGLMNDKMGGDLEKIKTVGQYFVEIWKSVGMDMKNVRFEWASDGICKNAGTYWPQVLDISRVFTLARIRKCCTAMGRLEASLSCAQILYPLMQCTDIFFLKADICQLGVDQRKINMLAREYCDAAGRKLKPIILSHHMIYGLLPGQAKMSKSNPDSAVFMEDSPSEVERKIAQAYCPTEVTEETKATNQKAKDGEMSLVEDLLKNPCLDYVRYFALRAPGSKFEVNGTVYTNPDDVERDVISKKIPEAELKKSLTKVVNNFIQPVREHFEKDPFAKSVLEKVKEYKKIQTPPEPKFYRAKIVELTPAKTYAAFAPMPCKILTLQHAAETLAQLRACPAGMTAVLWIQDWSAYTLNTTNGDWKALNAFYKVFLAGLRAMDANLMKDVKVIYQSELILEQPSDYWLSVINAGRKCQVEDVALMPGAKVVINGKEEGTVMGTRCEETDTFSVEADNGTVHAVKSSDLTPVSPLTASAQVFYTPQHTDQTKQLPTTTTNCLANYVFVAFDATAGGLHRLASAYLAARGKKGADVQELTVKDMHARNFRLLEGGDDEVGNLLLLEAMDKINTKVKRAYCNANDLKEAYNPPLSWAGEIMACGQGPVSIKRKPENGGDVDYTSIDALRTDFENDKVHPGDLKPAVSKVLQGTFEKIRNGIKADKEAAQAQKTWENFLKKCKKAGK